MIHLQNRLRPQTAHLTCRLLAPLLDSGLVTAGELAIIRKNLCALAKTGEMAPTVAPKLIRGPEAAELLSISYAEFRKLVAEGVFPFRRRVFGKNVRFYYPDIVDFMRTGGIENDPKPRKNN